MKNLRLSIAILILTATVPAQVNKSNLVGLVRDSSGAAVPGVAITVKNESTGALEDE